MNSFGETCQIHLETIKPGSPLLFTRDHCRFYAEAIGRKGRYIAARSDEFNVYADQLGSIDEFLEKHRRPIMQALDALIAQLTSEGWQPLTVGDNWWNYRFQRQQ